MFPSGENCVNGSVAAEQYGQCIWLLPIILHGVKSIILALHILYQFGPLCPLLVCRACNAVYESLKKLNLKSNSIFLPSSPGLLDYQAMKNALLPRIKKLCINTNLLSVRVNALICIGKLLQNLDKWLVMDEILPMLQQIPSREPAVIMAIIGN